MWSSPLRKAHVRVSGFQFQRGRRSGDQEGQGSGAMGSHHGVVGAGWGDETWRADVLVFTPEGKDRRIFATGIKNCVGLAVHPATGDVWCSTNERDELGDNLVPDYVTRVREGGFYGGPGITLRPQTAARKSAAVTNQRPLDIEVSVRRVGGWRAARPLFRRRARHRPTRMPTAFARRRAGRESRSVWVIVTPLQFLRNPDKVAAPLSELRREYADPRAVPSS